MAEALGRFIGWARSVTDSVRYGYDRFERLHDPFVGIRSVWVAASVEGDTRRYGVGYEMVGIRCYFIIGPNWGPGLTRSALEIRPNFHYTYLDEIEAVDYLFEWVVHFG